jgi:hypothetical protein
VKEKSEKEHSNKDANDGYKERRQFNILQPTEVQAVNGYPKNPKNP